MVGHSPQILTNDKKSTATTTKQHRYLCQSSQLSGNIKIACYSLRLPNNTDICVTTAGYLATLTFSVCYIEPPVTQQRRDIRHDPRVT